jgi:hypothetical protein
MKFIIWGHKLHSHTHSYIHNGYKKALEYLGYEVYWLDHNDKLENFNFSDSIFFTEDQAKKGMPLRNDCKYIVHHINKDYFNGIENVLNLGNYTVDVEKFDKIKDQCYFDSFSNTLFQCWATDLTPNVINENDFCVYDNSKNNLNYIGTLYEEGRSFSKDFEKLLKKLNKKFILYKNVSDIENYNLTRNSFLSPDFRGLHHIKVGYIPCRVFKNISYGQMTGTNSVNIKRVLGDYVIFGSDPLSLLENMIIAGENNKINMKNAMLFIKDNHTYVNRISNILKFL